MRFLTAAGTVGGATGVGATTAIPAWGLRVARARKKIYLVLAKFSSCTPYKN